jgi:hypothetical protein
MIYIKIKKMPQKQNLSGHFHSITLEPNGDVQQGQLHQGRREQDRNQRSYWQPSFVPRDCFSAYPVAVTAVPKVAGMKPSRIFMAISLRHLEL